MPLKIPALEPAIIVIFGITGDLAQRYILPALYHLLKDNLLHPQTEIVGITRSAISAEELLERVELCVNEIDQVCDPEALQKMHAKLSMHHMNVTSGTDYDTLHEYIDSLETKHDVCMNRLYYLSIPPQVFGPIVRFLGEHGMNASCQHGTANTRLLIEKPFGYDVASATELIGATAEYFGEEQVFRIDHYLAKETVQNVLAFRFANTIFQPVWNKDHVAEISITASEKIGIERRINFYDQTGALRDFQSHLLQLLALVTMEKPEELTSEAIHAAKLRLLESVNTVPSDKVAQHTLRAQYEGYREEVGNPRSNTETFASIQLSINNPTWEGVPIRLTTGKALQEKRTDIKLIFKASANATANSLCFRIQPDEGIELGLVVKEPGFDHDLAQTKMDFSYKQNFSTHPSAYERVLVDAVRGDHTLFATADEITASWRIIHNVLETWAAADKSPSIYRQGSTVHQILSDALAPE